jgi:hypothetical protein
LVGIRGPCGGISDNPRGSLLFIKEFGRKRRCQAQQR